ncbi:Hypothetical predicted protein [Lecanosticta acicola]|uniref:Sequence orphan n=1 Tax=Lecanosticta acicola TaxID=111012 RepID=A0AAI9EC00_9PEZI|nr:Hypothetical predicted protein [Lecanosticta acicola]
MTAAVAVTPVMTVIDRAVVEAAAGQSSLMASVRSSLKQMVRQPHKSAAPRPFGAMLLLYAGTYFTANAIDTVSANNEGLRAESTTSSTTKLCAVTGVNVGLALNKDSCFARSFGTAATRSRALPRISYVPFLVRDGITLFATFNLPGRVASSFPDEVEKYMSRLSAAQLIMPAASQFVTTPLHLLGLDLYYRNGKLGFWERVKAAKRAWLSTSLARACRIIPAYGIGGIVNNDSRAYLMMKMEGRKRDPPMMDGIDA